MENMHRILMNSGAFKASLRPMRSIRRLGNSSRIKSPHDESLKDLTKKRYEQNARQFNERLRYKNRTSAFYAASVGIITLTLGFAAVPLYRAICQRTGWGGIPITDSKRFTADKVIPVDTSKRIRVSFTCQTSGIMPWKFTPQQREVFVVPGETALAFYKAKNTADEDIIGMATYSVIPEAAAKYFNKIQCFCFEEQRLSAGEEVDMPVFFFIDPDFAKDPQMRNVDDIVLNYAFFKAHYADDELVAVPTAPTKKEATIP